MSTNFIICNTCQTILAEFFCACTYPELFLCGNCFLEHARKCPTSEHIPRPLTQWSDYKRSDYLETLKKRRETFSVVYSQVWSQVNSVDKVIAEIEQTAQEIASLINSTVAELRLLKAELSASVRTALEEVEATLTEQEPKLTTNYGPTFRALIECPREFQLFSLKVHTTPPQSVVTYESRVSLPQELLGVTSLCLDEEEVTCDKFPAVCGRTLTLYDLHTQQTLKNQLAVDFGTGGSYLEIGNYQLLCLGGDPASTAVYLLDLVSYQLTKLPPLCEPRRACGVIRVAQTVYAFGGFDGKKMLQSASEKRSSPTGQSCSIGGMHYARAWFTPCGYLSQLYLLAICSQDHTQIETFTPEIDAFKVLSIVLPPHLLFNRRSLTFVVNGELCFLTANKQMARWKIGEEGEFRVEDINRGCGSAQTPRKVGDVIMIADAGEVIRFSLITNSFL